MISAETPAIDYLILNAGAVTGPAKTKDKFELMLGTNHVGHFYLTKTLLPTLKSQGGPARIVVLSSNGHSYTRILHLDDLNWEKRGWGLMAAHGQSKLCNALFAVELARQAKESGDAITAFSLHPGIIKTPLLTGNTMFLAITQVLEVFRIFTKTLAQGAATSVYAAVAPELDGLSGAYLSNCKVVKPSALARNATLARELWTKTEELIDGALKSRNPRLQCRPT